MGLLRHKAIVHRFYDEAFNNGHLDVLDELLAPEMSPTTPCHQA